MKKVIIVSVILIIIISAIFIYFKNNMKISSPSFKNGDRIPEKFTCDGQNISPELNIENIPSGTKSLAIIADDPDAPGGLFTHWIVYNINPDIKNISEGAIPAGAVEENNDFNKTDYGGPCPPKGKDHRYFFTLYALNSKIDAPAGLSRKEFDSLLTGHVIGKTEVMGIYSR